MNRNNRVSQDKVAETIATAIAVENQRIELLSAKSIDEISGGQTTPPNDPIGGTVGYFPPETGPGNNA